MTLALFDIKATEGSPTEFTQGEGGVLDGMAVWYVLLQASGAVRYLKSLILARLQPSKAFPPHYQAAFSKGRGAYYIR